MDYLRDPEIPPMASSCPQFLPLTPGGLGESAVPPGTGGKDGPRKLMNVQGFPFIPPPPVPHPHPHLPPPPSGSSPFAHPGCAGALRQCPQDRIEKKDQVLSVSCLALFSPQLGVSLASALGRRLYPITSLCPSPLGDPALLLCRGDCVTQRS